MFPCIMSVFSTYVCFTWPKWPPVERVAVFTDPEQCGRGRGPYCVDLGVQWNLHTSASIVLCIKLSNNLPFHVPSFRRHRCVFYEVQRWLIDCWSLRRRERVSDLRQHVVDDYTDGRWRSDGSFCHIPCLCISVRHIVQYNTDIFHWLLHIKIVNIKYLQN